MNITYMTALPYSHGASYFQKSRIGNPELVSALNQLERQ